MCNYPIDMLSNGVVSPHPQHNWVVSPHLQHNEEQSINHQLQEHHIRSSSNDKLINKMDNYQQQFTFHWNNFNGKKANFNSLLHQQNRSKDQQIQLIRQKLEREEQNMQTMVNNIVKMRMNLNSEHSVLLSSLEETQKVVLDHVLGYRRNQREAACYGAEFTGNLDSIQEWCQSLNYILWCNKQQLDKVGRLRKPLPTVSTICMPPDVLPELSRKIVQLMNNLIKSTFVIESQPRQVLKTNTRFSATVRLLVGGKLNIDRPQVKVSVISERQASALFHHQQSDNSAPVAEILNNTGTMEYQASNHTLSLHFKHLSLKKNVRRSKKAGAEAVCDKKCALLFETQFCVGNQFQVKASAISLPCVITVHGNQDAKAWATITWDNAFADVDRVPFQVPDEVPWLSLAQVLSNIFKAQCGRGLTEENLQFLAGKLFRNPNIKDYSLLNGSWRSFSKRKDHLPESLNEEVHFTFSDWFFSILKLVRDHLQHIWKENLIVGFISKQEASKKLMQCQDHTFLLRFSDSKRGGISISYVTTLNDGQRQISSIAPQTSEDFKIRCYANRLRNLQITIHEIQIKIRDGFLYPDIPMEDAFSTHLQPDSLERQRSRDYIPIEPFDKVVIPIEAPQATALPTTPQTMTQTQQVTTPQEAMTSQQAMTPQEVTAPDEAMTQTEAVLQAQVVEPMDENTDCSVMLQQLLTEEGIANEDYEDDVDYCGFDLLAEPMDNVDLDL